MWLRVLWHPIYCVVLILLCLIIEKVSPANE
jgi:hypothetical protein